MAKSFNTHRVTTKPEAKKKRGKGRGRHGGSGGAIYRKKTLADGLMLSREYNADQNVRGHFQEQASAAARVGAEHGLHGSQAFRGRMPLSRSMGAHDERPWQAMGRYGQTNPFQRHQQEVRNRFREQWVNARQGVPPVARAGRMGGGRAGFAAPAAGGGAGPAMMAAPRPPPRPPEGGAGRPPVRARMDVRSLLNPAPPRLRPRQNSPIIIPASALGRPFLPEGAGLPRALTARSSSDSSASTAPFGGTPRTPMSPPTPPITPRSSGQGRVLPHIRNYVRGVLINAAAGTNIPTLRDVSVPTGVATPQGQMIPTQAVSAQHYDRGIMGRGDSLFDNGVSYNNANVREQARAAQMSSSKYANKGNTRRALNYVGGVATRTRISDASRMNSSDGRDRVRRYEASLAIDGRKGKGGSSSSSSSSSSGRGMGAGGRK